MRVALVSPYSWTYPGGVTRHIEALAVELDRAGHDVKVLAPFDPDRRRTAVLHRGARPQVREVPEWLVPLGGDDRLAVQRRGLQSRAARRRAVSTLRRELRAGGFDVVHVHEPVAPIVGWDALTSADAPLVGTFHCYSESVPPHKVAALLGARRKLNHLNVRIAVSEAAAWTGRRFYGGRYRVIPNGVVAARGRRAGAAPARARRAAADRVRRPGRRAQGPARAAARLRGAAPRGARRADRDRLDAEELAPLLVDGEGVTALGRVDDAAKEARAARGRPAVRAVAGRRVVRDGADRGVRGRHAGRRLRHRGLPRRRRRTASTACWSRAATRRRWPRRCATSRSTRARVEALAAQRGASAPSATRGRGSPSRSSPPTRTRAWCRQPESATRARGGARSALLPGRRPGARPGAAAAVAGARARGRRGPRWRGARCSAAPALATAVGSYLAVQHIGLERIGDALVRSQPALGAVRPGADVRLDAAARRLLARDPEGGAARRAPADGRRRAGHDDRRADVGDAAGPARRAVARAGRGAPARPRARPLAGGARHARLADADQRARAGDPRRGDVHHDRAVRRPPAGAALVRRWRRSACSASCWSRRR